MKRSVVISDTPRRVSVANYEQRLRKYRMLIALLVEEIDDVLRQLEQERKNA